jgi:Zn-finger nucleic acid-binding protein
MEIEVDECSKCAGTWLDGGELCKIREQFENDEDRRTATREYIRELFDHELAEMSAQSLERLEKTKTFARMLRLICPSYYLSGKQSWGAF